VAVGPRVAVPARRSQADRRADSEQRLLRATTILVSERGTEAMSLAEIATAAGCSRGLPVYLFGSKQGLLLALVDDVMKRFRDEMLEPALAGKSGLAAVLATIEAFLRPIEHPGPAARTFNILVGEAIGPRREFAGPVNRLHRRVHAHFLEHIRDGMAAGEIRPDLDAEATAWTLVAMLRGAGTLTLVDPDGLDVGAFIGTAIDHARRALVVEPT